MDRALGPAETTHERIDQRAAPRRARAMWKTLSSVPTAVLAYKARARAYVCVFLSRACFETRQENDDDDDDDLLIVCSERLIVNLAVLHQFHHTKAADKRQANATFRPDPRA